MLFGIAGLLLAGAVTLVVTPWVRRQAFRWGAVDRPNARKVHHELMPRLGGLAVYLGFMVAVLATMQPGRAVYGLLLGMTLITLVGALDDIRGLSPRVKLGGQITAALILLPFGIQVFFITNPVSGQILYLGDLGMVITVFWVVAVTNAVNLIDGLDGLAGGVSCIAALTMAVVGWTQWHVFGAAGQQEVIWLALILTGALLGFLRYNFHPARIFLGDSGSMLLGYTLAAMAVMGLTKSVTAVSVVVPMVILGIPLLDTTFAVLRRYHKHRSIFQPDKEHLHHQLLAIGLSHRQAVLVIYAISALLGASAVILNLVATDQAMALLVVLAVIIITAANRVGILGGVVGKTSPKGRHVSGKF
ncbi:undecaprenyl/decaprenyl-phosphate alpha-N-acetylglucosaminyl 1-phosphate transferase [Desulfofundulus thermobenzoicus]|uniref:Undecaprenyl/decaprenyl-phosphate alpha-N-acetylglucosaminyl 1-phosphate transferase n=1 Tax=Desulfofundulus thermobenzoicus TaxID=29376 RepID=A0A6N7INP5_9FIRM|nr:MraY family glycosyltransferase [Desulfofundulus thermobenzoicus]MQL51521.1 undecaprenyl/decaprenyl-phosphate alpha-N-acetylglucosaminyl 1-phosphate transferase [Desulfofundulus thermobenzoicus]